MAHGAAIVTPSEKTTFYLDHFRLYLAEEQVRAVVRAKERVLKLIAEEACKQFASNAIAAFLAEKGVNQH